MNQNYSQQLANGQQFKPKNRNFWKWILYVGISAFLVVVVWSINHMTPGLLPIAIAMGFAGAAVSFVYTVFTTTNSGSLRWRAWVGKALVTIGLAINVVIHAGLSRRYDVAVQARQARHLEEQRDEERKNAQAAREKDLAQVQTGLLEKQAKLIEAQKKLTDSQNYQLSLVSRGQRQQIVKPESKAPAGDAPAATLATTLSTAEAAAPAAVVTMKTPEQVQEESWWFVLLGICIEVGMIVGTFVHFVRGLIGDANKNNVADWKEELDPVELYERYPDDYRKLYGDQPPYQSVPRQSPVMSPQPATASTRYGVQNLNRPKD